MLLVLQIIACARQNSFEGKGRGRGKRKRGGSDGGTLSQKCNFKRQGGPSTAAPKPRPSKGRQVVLTAAQQYLRKVGAYAHLNSSE